MLHPELFLAGINRLLLFLTGQCVILNMSGQHSANLFRDHVRVQYYHHAYWFGLWSLVMFWVMGAFYLHCSVAILLKGLQVVNFSC